LPAEKTETGTWAGYLPPFSEYFPFRIPISFPIPLKEGSEKVFYFNQVKVEAQEFGTSGCKWEKENVNAKPESIAPGALCVFVSEERHIEPNAVFHTPGEEFAFGYGPSGSTLEFTHQLAPPGLTTPAEANGVWAVTAP
jgi:hypothetical protein